MTIATTQTHKTALVTGAARGIGLGAIALVGDVTRRAGGGACVQAVVDQPLAAKASGLPPSKRMRG